MPKSFMATHRCFGKEDLSISFAENNRSIMKDGNYDIRIDSDSPVSRRACCSSDLPHMKEEPVHPNRRTGKPASVSDADSDSGVSSQNDSRHELPPELEYRLDCSSRFMRLLDLLKQDLPPFSGCDVLVNNIMDREQLLKRKILAEGNSSTATGEVASLGSRASLGQRGSRDPQATIDVDFCLHSKNRKGIEPVNKTQHVSYDTIKKNAGLVYDDDDSAIALSQCHYCCVLDEAELYTKWTSFDNLNNQHGCRLERQERRRSCEYEKEEMEADCSFTSGYLMDDKPIDYSQLSSRWKETRERDRTAAFVHLEKEHLEKLKKSTSECLPEAMCDISNETITAPVMLTNVQFILSPKIYKNQTSKQHGELSMRASKTSYQTSAGKKENTSSLTSVSPNTSTFGNHASGVSLSQHNLKTTEASIPNISVAKSEPSTCNPRAGFSKSANTYHPKLKYLLAASRHVPDEKQQGQETAQSTEDHSIGPHPFCNKETFTSHDKCRQNETLVPLDNFDKVTYSTNVSSNKLATIKDTSNVSVHDNVSSGNTYTSILNFKNVTKQEAIDIDPTNISLWPRGDISILHGLKRTPGEFPSPEASGNTAVCSTKQAPTSTDCLDHISAPTERQTSANTTSGIENYACADCSKRYSTVSNLARHRKTHKTICDKKARKCPYCEKMYVSPAAYSMHARTHSRGSGCPYCGKHFSRPWLLQGHIRTHTGEKPFPCPQCGKPFADKSNLRAHVQTHATEKPYVCVRCGKAFALKSYLCKHEASSCMKSSRLKSAV